MHAKLVKQSRKLTVSNGTETIYADDEWDNVVSFYAGLPEDKPQRDAYINHHRDAQIKKIINEIDRIYDSKF